MHSLVFLAGAFFPQRPSRFRGAGLGEAKSLGSRHARAHSGELLGRGFSCSVHQEGQAADLRDTFFVVWRYKTAIFTDAKELDVI